VQRCTGEEDQEMTLKEALDVFVLNCEVKNLSPETVRWYSKYLRSMIRFLEEKRGVKDIESVDVNSLRSYILYLQREKTKWDDHPVLRNRRTDKIASSSINCRIRAFKVFFRFLVEDEHIEVNPSEKIKPIRSEKKIIETFSIDQVKKIIGNPRKKSFTGTRDQAVIQLLFDTGMRISELVGLKMEDVDFNEGTARVFGKGKKERRVPFGMRTRNSLRKYLSERNRRYEGEHFFLSKGGRRLAMRSVQDNLRKMGLKLKIEGVRVSPHTFRHTFAKNYVRNGGDIFSLQRILGHTTLDMVRRYVNLSDDDIRNQHRKYGMVDRI